MVPSSHLSPQPKRYLDWLSLFCRASHNHDRQTDHATWSVTIGRICVRSTAMQPNNNNKWSKNFDESPHYIGRE